MMSERRGCRLGRDVASGDFENAQGHGTRTKAR